MPRRFIKFAVSDDQYAVLKAAANDVGVPPSVHARYLALHAGQLSLLADRVAATAADVAELRRVLAALVDPNTGLMVDKASLKRGMQMLLDAIRADLKTTLTQR
ncbi:hypothetical protein CH75_16785 [Dyella jiangningensis]|nr:hypothetical protein CH75_16785 [Dyella jiangningensis]